MHEQFKKAFQKYENDFVLFETKELIEKGVFGKFNGDKNKELLGDFMAIGTDTNKILIFQDGKQLHGKVAYRGHHTGMTKDEMLLPLIICNGRSVNNF